MRPIARPQSALRSPLNDILGTEANVRILRTLAGTSLPMAPTEIAAHALLNLSGAVRALATLEEAGIVERVGSGRRQPVVLRRQHPLARALESLFAEESQRVQRLVSRLKEYAGRLVPPPKSVWVEGPVATQRDRLGESVRVGVLTTTRDLDHSVSAMQSHSVTIERELDVTIEVHGLSEPDLAALPPNEAKQLHTVLPILGPPPAAFLGGREKAPRRRSHAALDDDAKAMAAAVGRHLKRDPSIAERAQRFVKERLETASKGEQRELREWDSILRNMSPARLRRFLVDPGARATRLRQTMPFLAVLSVEERSHVQLEAARLRAARDKAS
jgi:DNA-binding transcriptional ArsR family regulator